MKEKFHEKLLRNVGNYYNARLNEYGPTARGVDWNSEESQELRFEQLLKVCDTAKRFSINDYGCGYGALADYMARKGYAFEYLGYDISEKMIMKAKEIHAGWQECTFSTDESSLSARDYTLASGIFNVKLREKDDVWREYVLDTLGKLNSYGKGGFAFNMLTKYSDPEYMRDDLYYADPLFFFDYCKTHFSRFVALLHDYPLYEFTILVKK